MFEHLNPVFQTPTSYSATARNKMSYCNENCSVHVHLLYCVISAGIILHLSSDTLKMYLYYYND